MESIQLLLLKMLFQKEKLCMFKRFILLVYHLLMIMTNLFLERLQKNKYLFEYTVV